MRHKLLRRQRRPPQVIPGQSMPPYIQFPVHADRHRLHGLIQYVHLRVGNGSPNRRSYSILQERGLNRTRGRHHGIFCWPVIVHELEGELRRWILMQLITPGQHDP